ncbi:glycosyltransferase [bacterium]|nr:glycosyltransferase [bacterium]
MTERIPKVAHLIGNLETGGTQALILELMRRTDRRRFDPCIVYFRDPNHFADAIASSGWQCSKVKVSRGLESSGLRLLAEHLRHRGVDIVHCHSDHANFAGRTAALMAGIRRIIVHYHNTYEHRLNDGFRTLEQLLAPATAVYAGCSQGVADFMRANLDLGGRPLRLLRNGVNLAPYLEAGRDPAAARAQLGVPAEVFHIVHSARLEPHKQPGMLLEALALSEQRPETSLGDWRLTFLGGGSLRESLEARLRELDEEAAARGLPRLSPRVHFTGWTKDVPRWLATADVYALVSRNEGFSLSLVEAMAAGAVTIAGDIVGPREVIGSDENGLLVDTSQPQAILGALLRYRRDPAYMKRVRESALKRAEQFSIETFVRQTEELYDDLAQWRGIPPPRPSSWLWKQLLPYRAGRLARRMRKGR